MKAIFIGAASVFGIVALGYLVMLGQRLYHNNQRKLSTVNTFAIQNKKTGMDIRPFNAGIGDEVKIIQYKHHNWECMTWQFIKLEDGSYLLKNLYTHKTFQSSSALESGVTLWQQPLEANKFQYWEFLRQSEDEYLIRLKDSELYVTVSDDKNNSSIILMPMQNKLEQHWKLIEQHPTM